MSKQYYRDLIAQKRKNIIDLKSRITKITETKKKTIESIDRSLKNTSSISSKASYRKQKITVREKAAKDIESLKKQIESIKSTIENYKKISASIK